MSRKKRKSSVAGDWSAANQTPTSVEHRSQVRNIPKSRKVLYSLAVVMLFFTGAEFLTRWLGGSPSQGPPPVGTRKFVKWLSGLSSDDVQGPALYREDRQLLWRLVTNAQITTSNHHHAPGGERQQVRITINGQGYRGRMIGAGREGSTFRVLCLGDSNFFGYPLDDRYAFPQALENALTRDKPTRPIEVFNGGVPGYTVVQGKQWYLERFRQHRFDVILLSYLNNDAWLQPQTDAQLISRYASATYAVSKLLHHSHLITRLGSWLSPTVSSSEYVPRVPREEFVRNYEFFLAAAKQAQTRVIVVDHRAYPEYEPYSQELRGLARHYAVDYFPVAEGVSERLKNLQTVAEYPELAQRACRRWGDLLVQRPYLWYYAEYYPEHLNELGAAWLADQIAPLIRARLEATPAVGPDPRE